MDLLQEQYAYYRYDGDDGDPGINVHTILSKSSVYKSTEIIFRLVFVEGFIGQVVIKAVDR